MRATAGEVTGARNQEDASKILAHQAWSLLVVAQHRRISFTFPAREQEGVREQLERRQSSVVKRAHERFEMSQEERR
jgi:hypothetical protein